MPIMAVCTKKKSEGEEKMPTCKACGQKIKWAMMPDGKVSLDEKPLQMIQVTNGIGKGIEVYSTHWATCLKSKKFKEWKAKEKKLNV